MRLLASIPAKQFGILTFLLFSVCSAWADEPQTGLPVVHKLTIASGGIPRVYYSSTSTSPRLQALCRTLQWAENEMTIVEQLQQMKLDQLAYERHRMLLRLAALTNPYSGNGGGGGSVSDDIGDSALSFSLAGVLADEARPEAALHIIQLLEKAQTDLAEELKKAPKNNRTPLEDGDRVLRKALGLLHKKTDGAAAKRTEPRPAAGGPRASERPLSGMPAQFTPAFPPTSRAVVSSAAQDIQRAAQTMQQEREAFEKEYQECNRLLNGTPEERQSAQQRLQKAQGRYVVAMQHWAAVTFQQVASELQRPAVPPTQSPGGQ